MAIIYTYPVKAIPNTNDLILISDSQDSNNTKQVTIGSLPGGSGSGVSSVTSSNVAITVADASTTPVLTSVAYKSLCWSCKRRTRASRWNSNNLFKR